MVSLKGTNQEFGRPYNRRIVLEAILARTGVLSLRAQRKTLRVGRRGGLLEGLRRVRQLQTRIRR